VQLTAREGAPGAVLSLVDVTHDGRTRAKLRTRDLRRASDTTAKRRWATSTRHLTDGHPDRPLPAHSLRTPSDNPPPGFRMPNPRETPHREIDCYAGAHQVAAGRGGFHRQAALDVSVAAVVVFQAVCSSHGLWLCRHHHRRPMSLFARLRRAAL